MFSFLLTPCFIFVLVLVCDAWTLNFGFALTWGNSCAPNSDWGLPKVNRFRRTASRSRLAARPNGFEAWIWSGSPIVSGRCTRDSSTVRASALKLLNSQIKQERFSVRLPDGQRIYEYSLQSSSHASDQKHY